MERRLAWRNESSRGLVRLGYPIVGRRDDVPVGAKRSQPRARNVELQRWVAVGGIPAVAPLCRLGSRSASAEVACPDALAARAVCGQRIR